jgi:hypothetical protein
MAENDGASSTVAEQIDLTVVKTARVEQMLMELVRSGPDALRDANRVRQLGKSLVSLGGDITDLGVSLALSGDGASLGEG